MGPPDSDLYDIYAQDGSLRPYIIFHWIQFETVGWDAKDFNSSFKKRPPDSRLSARVDGSNMIQVFEKLQFHGRKVLHDHPSQDPPQDPPPELSPTILNASNKAFTQELTKFKKKCVEKKDRIKCITVVISSHGAERKVTRDQKEQLEHQIRVSVGFKRNPNTGEFLDEVSNNEDDFFISTTHDLVKPFTDELDLQHIPKIFLIQACSDREASGSVPNSPVDINIDQGISIQLVDDVNEEYTDLPAVVHSRGNENPVQAQDDQGENRDQNQSPVLTYIPECEENCIMVFSSPSGFKCTSGDPLSRKGSILVEALSDSLKAMERTEFTLMDYVTQANRLASLQQDRRLGSHRVTYMPLLRIVHQLSKDIKLKKTLS